MKIKSILFLIILGTCFFSINLAKASFSATEINKLLASDKQASDVFGYDVSISGDYAVVGSKWEDTGGADAGSAYIFKNTAGTWAEVQKIQASDKQAGDYFGNFVFINGDYAVIAAPYEDTGASNAGSAYIFKNTADTWAEVQKIQASDAEANDNFGSSISIFGDFLIIGAPYENTTGSAYIFKNTAGTWAEVQKIQASDAEANDYFGSSVSVFGDYLIVGSWSEDTGATNSGAAYIFKNTAGTWAQVQKIQASDKELSDNFGFSVSISNTFLFVGATQEDTGGNGAGAVYIFENTAGTWAEVQKIQASDAETGDSFGISVSLSDNYAIIGAWYDDTGGVDAGSAYIFKNTLGTWAQVQKIQPTDIEPNDQFGHSVSISDNYIIVGSHYEDAGGGSAGASYVFQFSDSFSLTYTAGSNGSLTGTSPQTVNSGASGSAVTAVPTTGYHFVNWSDASTANPRTDTNVVANVSVTANFAINTYALTYTPGSNGSITGTSPQTINYGSDGASVTAVPATGYHFTSWDDGVLTATRTDTNITGNITVTANFAINTFTLTYTPGSNGSITGTSPQTINYGADSSAMTAVPASGYRFVDWSDGSTNNPRTDTNVTANITVTANFELIPGGGTTPVINPPAVGNGTRDASVSKGQLGNIETVSTGGVNLLTYINSPTQFSVAAGRNNIIQNHTIEVIELNLHTNTAVIRLHSEPIVMSIKLDETKEVDLDNDGANDMKIKFEDIYNNRAEFTLLPISASNEKTTDVVQLQVVATTTPIAITNQTLYNRLKGKIILKVEDKGQAYYVSPTKQEMYYLGRPDDAFRVMREKGVGITNLDLDKIADANNKYFKAVDPRFANKHLGKIFLQIQSRGEAWYVNPVNSSRYFLGRPADAFQVMKTLGLGISGKDFEKLTK